MSPNKNSLNALVREMRLGPEEIALRKEFLEFTQVDAGLLQEIHEHIENVHIDEIFADLFYKHLRSFPELYRLIPDEATVDRLKATQSRYFREMTGGIYGEEYVEGRMKVGLVHQQVGLQPKWYTAAYRKYLSFLLSSLNALYANDTEKFIATYDAVLKVVFFDMELALDTYFHNDKKKLMYQATHDALTGLPNRILLADRIDQALRQSNRLDNNVAILFIDLDRFKNINDSLGHNVGDRVIVAVSQRLAGSLREGDTIARLGGDEFAVVLTAVEQEAGIISVIEKLLQAVRKPIMVGQHELFVTASIGVAVYPMDGEFQDELLKNADTAMYWSKQEGSNTFRFYQREMNEHARKRLLLDTRLHKALENREFLLVYQPQINLVSGHIVGAEALIRWQTREGMIPPADFISVAEETGLILPVGAWVLEEACRQAVIWHRADIDPAFRVAVNLSARQIWEEDIVETVSQALAKTGCKPEWLELEITETTLMKHPEVASDTMQVLSSMGITIAIDDFGTGYSSLAYLKRFHAHSLKIDRSFIANISASTDDASIVRSVVALSHTLGLEVVGEGVEEVSQQLFLVKLGCDVAQGYLFSRPLSVDDMTQLLLKPATWGAIEVQFPDSMTWTRPATADKRLDGYRNCRVRWLGQREAICMAGDVNCIHFSPAGSHCRHPLVHLLDIAD